MQFSFFTHRHAQLVFLFSVCIIYDQIIQYALSCVYVYTFFLPGTVFISSKLIKFIFIFYYFFYLFFSMVVIIDFKMMQHHDAFFCLWCPEWLRSSLTAKLKLDRRQYCVYGKYMLAEDYA